MARPRVIQEGGQTRRLAPYNGGVAVLQGDFMYLDVADGSVKPLSSYALGSTEIIDQAAAGALFAGLAGDTRNAADPAVTNFPVMTDVEVEIDCTSATFINGDMVAFVRDSGPTYLEKVKVKKTTNPSACIGYVCGTYATATTRVWVRLLSRVWPNANPAVLGDGGAPVTVAATGSAQGDAAALSLDKLNTVTAADGTKGVILPIGAPGDEVEVYNAVATNGLKVYPATGGTLNGGSANAAVTIEGKTLAGFKNVDGVNWATMFTVNT